MKPLIFDRGGAYSRVRLIESLRYWLFNAYKTLTNIWTFLAFVVTQTVTFYLIKIEFYQTELLVMLFHYLDMWKQRTEMKLIQEGIILILLFLLMLLSTDSYQVYIASEIVLFYRKLENNY